MRPEIHTRYVQEPIGIQLLSTRVFLWLKLNYDNDDEHTDLAAIAFFLKH